MEVSRGDIYFHEWQHRLQHATTENVNEPLNDNGMTLLEVASYLRDFNAMQWLVSLGAQVTFFTLTHACRVNNLRFLLEHGGDPNCVGPNGFHLFDYLRPKNHGCVEALLEYGWKMPLDCEFTANEIIQIDRVQARETRCRRALVALVAYCRRSKYAALRAAYIELAKWMWRMRGPAGCGPRGTVWNLEETHD